jgi:hypothetical protein
MSRDVLLVRRAEDAEAEVTLRYGPYAEDELDARLARAQTEIPLLLIPDLNATSFEIDTDTREIVVKVSGPQPIAEWLRDAVLSSRRVAADE